MGLDSAHHSADALCMASWLSSLAEYTEAHDIPSVESLLDRLPSLCTLLNQIATRLEGKGVPHAGSVRELLVNAGEPKRATRWRLFACARTEKSYLCDADEESVITCKESGGPGAASWLLPPVQA